MSAIDGRASVSISASGLAVLAAEKVSVVYAVNATFTTGKVNFLLLLLGGGIHLIHSFLGTLYVVYGPGYVGSPHNNWSVRTDSF